MIYTSSLFPFRLAKDDAMKWFQTKYDGIILNKGK